MVLSIWFDSHTLATNRAPNQNELVKQDFYNSRASEYATFFTACTSGEEGVWLGLGRRVMMLLLRRTRIAPHAHFHSNSGAAEDKSSLPLLLLSHIPHFHSIRRLEAERIAPPSFIPPFISTFRASSRPFFDLPSPRGGCLSKSGIAQTARQTPLYGWFEKKLGWFWPGNSALMLNCCTISDIFARA